MNAKASTRAEYKKALEKLDKVAIIGNHHIGALTISCTHTSWHVSDGHGNGDSGTARTGKGMREKIAKTVRKYAKMQNPAEPDPGHVIEVSVTFGKSGKN